MVPPLALLLLLLLLLFYAEFPSVRNEGQERMPHVWVHHLRLEFVQEPKSLDHQSRLDARGC